MQATRVTQERATTKVASGGAGDAELLRRFIDHRDPAAMSAIIERHGPLVMGLCRNILRNEQDAADAFQTTFLVLLKNAQSIGKPASLASWLHGVACRVALRARSQAAVRHRHETESAGATMAPNASIPSDNVADAETVRLVHEELCNLPERLRLPLILCGLQGESREEAARQLGWTVGSVKGRLERAREMLEGRLRKRGVVVTSALLTGLLVQQATSQVPTALAASTVKSLVLVAGGKTLLSGVVSANAAALTQGVLISMKVAKLKTAGLVALGLLFVTGSSGVIAYTVKGMIDARKPEPAVAQPEPATNLNYINLQSIDGKFVAANASGDVLLLSNTTNPNRPQEEALRKLKQLGLAMHNYHDAHRHFPFPATKAADGTPLLSWRVALLPYLDQAELYSQFRHDEPWDSPHNIKLVERMPAVFDAITLKPKRPSETCFQVFVGPNTIFHNGATRSMQQMEDGTSNTLMIVDAANPVPWTKPEDLVYDPQQPLPALGAIVPNSILCLMADGSTQRIEFSGVMPEAKLRAMITASGGDVVP